MSEPELPVPPAARYGRERVCPHCDVRVAQRAKQCFFCGAALDEAPRRRLSLPWADLFLFAAIGGVVAFWWLRAPQSPMLSQLTLTPRPLVGLAPATVDAAALIGEVLPTALPTATPAPLPTATVPPASPPPAGPIKHIVKAGDTVAGIAQQYGSTIAEIIQVNGLSADARLQAGQTLLVPQAGATGGPGAGPTATPSGGALMYTVRSGDTISEIATRFGSQTDWILTANKLDSAALLRVGQALLVPLSPVALTPEPTVDATPVTPTVTVNPGPGAPRLLNPAQGSVIAGNTDVLLSWTSVGILEPDQYYVVTLRLAGETIPAAVWWTQNTSWRAPAQYRGVTPNGAQYVWRVQVFAGSAEQPGAAISPPSAERAFTWR